MEILPIAPAHCAGGPRRPRERAAERAAGRAHGRVRGRVRNRAPAWALAALAALGSACVSVPAPLEIREASRATPADTIRAFGVFLRADLYAEEYRCFSQRFCREHKLSLGTYHILRDQLAREQPWFKLFAQADVVSEESVGPRAHRVVVEVAGRTWRVNLVREDFWRISAGDLEPDGFAQLEKLLEVRADASGERRLIATLPMGAAEVDASEISKVLIERRWTIDDVQPLDP